MAEREGGVILAEDMCEGGQCSDHPYRSNPGGICAFCLQEKLGKLVSSSISSSDPFSLPPPPPSSYSPPSFPSSSHLARPSASARISFLSSKHRRRKKTPTSAADARSNSLAPAIAEASASPRKKSFWSFLTTSYSSVAIPSSFSTKRRSTFSSSAVPVGSGDLPKDAPRREKEGASAVSVDYSASPSGSQASSSFGRKVSRSRSVGCGSRSFSGDFLERISNGFGDCTLRRVESHREAKPKASIHRHGDDDDNQRIKERAKCGGIFVGLGMISSSTYWLSATASADAFGDTPERLPVTRRNGAHNGRSRSWGWTLSSPMRAFRPVGSGGSRQTTIVSSGSDAVGGCSRGASRAAAGKPSTFVLI